MREARPRPQLREQGPQGPQEQASGSTGQGHSPHRWLWASGPRQREPPRGGAEATQTRVRTWFPPPQETGQSAQGDHGVQAPSPAGGSREVSEIRGAKRQRVGPGPQHTGAGSGRERNTDRADRRRARWKASRAVGFGNDPLRPAHSASSHMMPSGVQELKEEPRLRDAAAQQDGTLPSAPAPAPELTTAGIHPAASCPPGSGGGCPAGTEAGTGAEGRAGSGTAPPDTPGPTSPMWKTWVEPRGGEGKRWSRVLRHASHRPWGSPGWVWRWLRKGKDDQGPKPRPGHGVGTKSPAGTGSRNPGSPRGRVQAAGGPGGAR